MEGYTTKMVAEMTGLSHRRILQFCQTKTTGVPKFGKAYVLTDDHVAELERRKRPRGSYWRADGE